MKRVSWLVVVSIVFLVVLTSFFLVQQSVFEGGGALKVVDISGDGTVLVKAGSTGKDRSVFGAYYIEVDGVPKGYYTFASGVNYAGSGWRNAYSRSFSFPDAERVEVWSSVMVASGGDPRDQLGVKGNYCNLSEVVLIPEGWNSFAVLGVAQYYYLCSDLKAVYDGDIPNSGEIGRIKEGWDYDFMRRDVERNVTVTETVTEYVGLAGLAREYWFVGVGLLVLIIFWLVVFGF